eukprot:tig00020903_g15095.t1
MSSGSESEGDGSAGGAETRGQVLQRHKRELKELKAKCEKLMHAVKKNDKEGKKKVNDEIQKLEKELHDRHVKELASLDSVQKALEAASISEPAAKDDEHDAEHGEKKQTRAQKRRGKKAEEEAERERQREVERMNAPNPGLEESNRLSEYLKPQGFQIKDITSDGHCMFRAIADQLQLVGQPISAAAPHVILRQMAVDFMRKNPDDFAPFVVSDEGSFEDYCKQIADTAAWGSQLELQALSRCLNCKICVYSADSKQPIEIGGDQDSVHPLRVSFHRFLLSQGEHYNSIVPIPADA